MGIKIVLHRPYSRDLALCDFWLFPKLRGCRYVKIEMKEAVTNVIDTLAQEDFYGALKKLLERYNKGITAGWAYFEGDLSFMCVPSIKVPIRKTSGKLLNKPCSSYKNIQAEYRNRIWYWKMCQAKKGKIETTEGIELQN